MEQPQPTWPELVVQRAPMLLSATAFLVALRVLVAWEVPPAFVQTHFAFTYEGGLLKRGLVGEVLRLLGHTPSEQTVILFGTATAACAALLLLVPLARLYRAGRSEPGTLLYLLVIATASATFQPWFAYTGRFDALLFLLMATACGIAWRAPTALRWLLVLPLSLGLLIHEAALFLGVPLALTLWWLHAKGHAERAMVLVSGLALVWLAQWIAVEGSWTEEEALGYLTLMDVRFPELAAIDTAVQVPVRTSLAENAAYTWDWIRRQWVWRLIHHGLFALLHLPLALLALHTWRSCVTRIPDHERRRLSWSTLACLSPLLLYPIAHDHFRWWTFALMSIAWVWTVSAARCPDLRAAISDTFARHPFLVYFAFLAGLVGGPLGFIKAYHFL